MTDKLVWLDLETFGLEPDSPILEVGMIITDLNLQVLAGQSWLCWEGKNYEDAWENAPEIVRNMHGPKGESSGLVARARQHGIDRAAVETLAIIWLEQNGATGLPMCGNSLGTDKAWLREQMPELLETFHYRVIDVSSFKEACRHYNPPVFAKLPAKKEAHTALADLEESVAEFQFYRDNFIFDGRP